MSHLTKSDRSGTMKSSRQTLRWPFDVFSNFSQKSSKCTDFESFIEKFCFDYFRRDHLRRFPRSNFADHPGKSNMDKSTYFFDISGKWSMCSPELCHRPGVRSCLVGVPTTEVPSALCEKHDRVLTKWRQIILQSAVSCVASRTEPQESLLASLKSIPRDSCCLLPLNSSPSQSRCRKVDSDISQNCSPSSEDLDQPFIASKSESLWERSEKIEWRARRRSIEMEKYLQLL
jgi:hypothetical protein